MFILILFSSCVLACNSQLISIGAILPKDPRDVRTQFNRAVRKHNDDPNARFKIDAQIGALDESENNIFHSIDRTICRHFSRRIYAIVGAVQTSNSQPLRTYANLFQIPLLDARSVARSSNVDFSFNIVPSYAQALLDVLACYKQRDKTDFKNTIFITNAFVYLFESDISELQRLLDLTKINETFTFLLTKKIVTPSVAITLLTELQNSKTKYYVILDCNLGLARQILYLHAQSKRLGRKNFHYLIIQNDENWISDWREYGITVTSFHIVDKNDSRSDDRHAALAVDALDVLVHGFGRLLRREDDAFLLQNESMQCDGPDRTTPWQHGEKMARIVRKTSITGLTGFVAFDRYGNRKNSTIEVMETRGDGRASETKTWSEKDGWKKWSCIAEQKVREERKSVYVVTSILDEPFLMRVNDTFEGYCKDLADKIAQQLGIDYVFKLVNDSRYGGPVAHSSYGWDGMVGELLAEEADLAIAPLTITSARERVISFTKPFMTLGISVMMARPLKQKKDDFSFLKPLSMEVWFSILFAFVCVSVVLFFVTHISSNEAAVFDSLWFSFAALVQQGGDTLPRSLSGPIVVGFWWFFALIVVTSYTANLAAFLTAQRLVTPINSAQDLAKQTRVEYGIIQQGSTQEFFKNSQNPLYQQMWEFMQARKDQVMMESNDQGTNRVRNSQGTFAFLTESVKNDFINQREPCDTVKVGPNLDTKGYGIATSHDSPLRQQLSIAVLSLTESGFLDRLYSKWWHNAGDCIVVDKDFQDNELSLSNVAGIFYVLTAGLVLAALTAICTKFCARFL